MEHAGRQNFPCLPLLVLTLNKIIVLLQVCNIYSVDASTAQDEVKDFAISSF